MKKILSLSLFLVLATGIVHAKDNNTTSKQTEHNRTMQPKSNVSKDTILQKKLQEQMEREKKYAKEQKFYQGDDYNLSEHEVDPDTLKDIPVIEPDYDFDITDVYRDDI